jgi:hypothetical protein
VLSIIHDGRWTFAKQQSKNNEPSGNAEPQLGITSSEVMTTPHTAKQ